jgi:hypothetical protein
MPVAGSSPLPQPKSVVADFGHFVEWPNPRYSEVRLGRGRGWGSTSGALLRLKPPGPPPRPSPTRGEGAEARHSRSHQKANSLFGAKNSLFGAAQGIRRKGLISYREGTPKSSKQAKIAAKIQEFPVKFAVLRELARCRRRGDPRGSPSFCRPWPRPQAGTRASALLMLRPDVST